MKFVKILLIVFVCVMILGLNFQHALRRPGGGGLNTGIPRDHNYDLIGGNAIRSQYEDRPSTGKIDDIEIDDENPTGAGRSYISEKLIGIIHLPRVDDYDTALGYILALIKIAINWILGMLAFVALIYMLYNGFLILTSGSEDKNAEKGKKGIKTAVIAIAGIGLAWLIVSAMIWFIHIITETKIR